MAKSPGSGIGAEAARDFLFELGHAEGHVRHGCCRRERRSVRKRKTSLRRSRSRRMRLPAGDCVTRPQVPGWRGRGPGCIRPIVPIRGHTGASPPVTSYAQAQAESPRLFPLQYRRRGLGHHPLLPLNSPQTIRRYVQLARPDLPGPPPNAPIGVVE